MTLLLHQMRKDVRYVRWPLALWLALLVATTLAEALKLDVLVARPEEAMGLCSAYSALHALLMLLAWLIAARIVHADPVDDANAFWLTRPIGPRQMCAAKLTLILALFVVLPSLGRAIVAAAHGLSGPMLLRFFLEAALVELAFVLAAVLIATLTRDVARVALAVIALLVGFAALNTMALLGLFAWLPTLHGMLTRNSGLLVGAIVFLAGSLLVIRYQYARRRALFSLLLALGVVALSATTTAFWPWNFILRPHLPAPPFDVPAVTVSLADPTIEGRKYLYATFESGNRPPGWVVVPEALSSTLRLPNGRTMHASDDTWMAGIGTNELLMFPAPWGLTGDTLLAVRHVTQAAWLNDPFDTAPARGRRFRTRTGVRLPLLEVPLPLPASAGTTASRLEVDITCAAFQAVQAIRVPLTPGARARLAGLEITLLRFPERTPGRVDLDVRLSQPRFLFPRQVPAVAYVLLNGKRGEAAVGISSPSGRKWRRWPLGVVHSLVRYETLSFSGTLGKPLAIEASWMRDAELAIVPLEKLGTFTKTVRIPQLRLAMPE